MKVPATAPSGCWVPTYVQTAQTTLSNAVTIAVGANGKPCSEPDNPLAQTFLAGGNTGVLRLLRSSTLMNQGVEAPVVSANDLFHFQFIKTTGGAFSFSPMFGQPPEGSCTVYLSPGDALGHDGIPAAPSIASRLSAGASFTLTGPGGVQNLTPLAGAPGVSLGSYAPFAPGLPNQLTLSPGSYTIAAPGGAEVGPFSAGVTLPQPFTWTNQNTLSTVDRTQNLVLSWSGAPSGQVVTILGFSMDRPSNSSGVFYCTAPKNATSFTVPSEVLSALPATQSNILRSKGVIYVMTMTEANGTAFKAPGLDAAIAIAGYMFGTTVIFQ